MPHNEKRRRPAPFSLRLSFEERQKLEKQAAGVSLAAYVKDCLFGGDAPRRGPPRGTAPVKDHEVLGKLLAQLGASRLPNNLNQLAKAANVGTLPVNAETERELQRACQDVAAMRVMLMRGLGLRVPETHEPAETVCQTFTRAGARPGEPAP
jgi:hypothetical protein